MNYYFLLVLQNILLKGKHSIKVFTNWHQFWCHRKNPHTYLSIYSRLQVCSGQWWAEGGDWGVPLWWALAARRVRWSPWSLSWLLILHALGYSWTHHCFFEKTNWEITIKGPQQYQLISWLKSIFNYLSAYFNCGQGHMRHLCHWGACVARSLGIVTFWSHKNVNRLWSARISSLRCMHARYMQCLNDQARGFAKIDKELIKV